MLDSWIVGIYLIVTLVVGIALGRNIKDIKGFSIANKNYSTAVLVATITATFLCGADTLGGGEKAFKYGIVFLTFVLSNFIYTMILANIIAPRIDQYKGCISIADIMGVIFGKKAQIVTGIAGTLKDTTIIGAQLSAIGYVFHYFLGLPHSTGIFIAGGIIVIYSVFGGMKSVTITDVIQFIVLVVALPLIANAGLHKIGGYQQLFHLLPETHLKFIPENKLDFIQNIDIALVLALSIIGPTDTQRLLMAKDAKQATKAFRYSGLIYLIALSMIALIGLIAKILAPHLNAHMAVPYIVDLLPIGFRGLAIAGLLAISMSTADSLLNAVSVLLINDIITPLSKKQISEERKLQLARLSTFVIGLLSIIGAVSFESVLDIMMFGHVFWSPLIVAPFFFATIGFKLNKNSFWYSAIGAIIIVILWEVTNLQSILGFSSTVPGMIASTILLFASHYYYKCFKPIKYIPIPELSSNRTIESKKKSPLSNLRSKNFLQILLRLFAKMKKFSLVEFCYTKVKEYGASYQLFGAFTIFNYILFTETEYPNFLLCFKLIAGILCVGLFFAPELIRKYNKYFSLYWYFTLMITLPFISCSMVILHNGNFYWLLNISISLFFLALLVDWISFIGIMISGIVLSSITLKLYIKDLSFNPNGYDILLGLYMVISSIIFGTFFSRKREGFAEERLDTIKAMGGTIAHEVRTPLGSFNLSSQIISDQTDRLLTSFKQVEELAQDHSPILSVIEDSQSQLQAIKRSSQAIEKVANSTSLVIDMLLTNMKDPSQETHKDTYSIRQVIEDAVFRYPLEDKSIIKLKLEADFTFYGNELMFSHVIYNLLKNSIYYIRQAGKGEITITVRNDNGSNKLYFRDTAKGVTTAMLPHMFEKFYSKTSRGTGLGLAFCKSVMEELGGKITCHSIYGEFIEFILEFPVKSLAKIDS